MLVPTNILKTTASERLVKLYREQYQPDDASLSEPNHSLQYYLKLSCNPDFRAQTNNRIKNSLLGARLQHAGINAGSLYTYFDNILDLRETRRICEYSVPIYQKLLDIYQQSPPKTSIAYSAKHISLLLTPDITTLATELEPELIKFQRQILESVDWRSIGFLTTVLNFSNQFILEKLQPAEKFLLEPYLRFIEEHVAIPWQRVCAGAARYPLNSPTFLLIEQSLPITLKTAESVYSKIIRLFPQHHSKGGIITLPRIAHSCIRDLKMFQNYLWLCLLEQSMAPIEDELIDLCERVMLALGVDWEMMSLWSKVLVDDILNQLEPTQKDLLLPYAQGLHQAFLRKI